MGLLNAAARIKEKEVGKESDDMIDPVMQKGQDVADHILALEKRLHAWESPLGVIESPEPNPIDTIAAHCGWNPLVSGESMLVHFNGIEYQITRTVAS